MCVCVCVCVCVSAVPMMRTKSKERGGAVQWVSSSGHYGGGGGALLPPPHRGQERMEPVMHHPMEISHPSGQSVVHWP